MEKYFYLITKRDDHVLPFFETAIDGVRTFGNAKKYFKRAKMILEEKKLKDVEIELYNSILTNLKSEFWHDYKL